MIIIGVMTCNRIDILKLMAKSLYHTDMKDCKVRIYDDCSDSYGVDELKNIFPNANITRHAKRLGVDENMRYMYEDFLETNGDYFLNADNDLIFNKKWRKEGLRLIEKSDGMLSLFNTPNHLMTQDFGELLQKDDVGAAGVLFKRNVLELIVNELRNGIDQKQSLDWEWCKILNKNNIRVMTVKNSLIQHIGVEGLWSRRHSFDYGEGFIVDELNGQILNEVIKHMSDTVDKHIKRALTYHERGKIDLAIMEISKAIRKEPDRADAWFYMAYEAAAIGRYEDAQGYLKRACKLDPTNENYKKNYDNIVEMLSKAE